jgi:glycine cleavage system H protein
MGITDFAQAALGDIVYVQLPKVGETVTADKVCGEVESTKSVSEIFAPVTGKIVSINDSLSSTPELVNQDPYGNGWLAEIEVSGTPSGLLSASEYGQITA